MRDAFTMFNRIMAIASILIMLWLVTDWGLGCHRSTNNRPDTTEVPRP